MERESGSIRAGSAPDLIVAAHVHGAYRCQARPNDARCRNRSGWMTGMRLPRPPALVSLSLTPRHPSICKMPPMGKMLQVPSNSLFADRLLEPRKASTELRFGGVPRVKDDVAAPDDLDLARRGEEGALQRLIARHAELVYKVALSITGCEADAEDVAQEVFIGLPELLHSYTEECLGGWLTVVTTRKALMHRRTEKRHSEYEILPVDVDSHEERMLSGIVVERALGQLDPTLRAVFVLRELEGFSHKEIAAVFEISENNSRVRLFRARQALREMLTA